MSETCPMCGHLVGDVELAKSWHQRNGDPQDLSGLRGANDVAPLPPKDAS